MANLRKNSQTRIDFSKWTTLTKIQNQDLRSNKLREDYQKLKEKYGEFNSILLDDYLIPVSIFNSKFSPLEALVKYLHENCGLKYSKISNLLGRDERNIWTIYSQSREGKVEIKDLGFVPISIFRSKLSVLESLIQYLLSTKSLQEISTILGKSRSTVWIAAKRASEKKEKFLLGDKKLLSVDIFLDKDFLNFEKQIKKLSVKHNVSVSEIFTLFDTTLIPISVFGSKYSPLESLVKYLFEQKGLQFSEIARLLNRDPRTIWTEYNIIHSRSRKLLDKKSKIQIPIEIFSDRKYSVLESLVMALDSLGKSTSEISRLIKRSPKTVYTVRDRAKKKYGR